MLSRALILCLLIIGSLVTNICVAMEKHITSTDWSVATKEVIEEYEPGVDKKFLKLFTRAQIHYPPTQVALLIFKSEKKLELWARDQTSPWGFIKTYPLKANSGTVGPKLHRNDNQIPEGVYRITEFNPFSSWHLSLHLDYPNTLDHYFAKLDHREDLGDNIYIHGKNLSVGCIAVGDKAIEELFVLIYLAGRHNTEVIIAPNDLRREAPLNLTLSNKPSWVSQLDMRLTRALYPFGNHPFLLSEDQTKNLEPQPPLS